MTDPQYEWPAEAVEDVARALNAVAMSWGGGNHWENWIDESRAALTAMEPYRAAEIAAAEKRGAVGALREASAALGNGFGPIDPNRVDEWLDYWADQVEGVDS